MPNPKENQNQNQEVNEQEKKSESLKKQLQIAEDEYKKQQMIMDQLKKRSEDLKEYNDAQKELFENREREIDIYDFKKRRSFKEDIRKELPENEEKYRKLKEGRDKEYFTDEISNLIEKNKKNQENDKYIGEDRTLKVGNMQEYINLISEVDKLRNDISEDKDHPLTKEQNEWVSNAKDDLRVHSPYTQTHYHHYTDNKKIFNEKEEAYKKEFGTENREKRWNEEFAEYQTLVARRMALKNAIKKIAMEEKADQKKDKKEDKNQFKIESTFKDLDKLKNSKEGSAERAKFELNKAMISKKMSDVVSIDMRTKDLLAPERKLLKEIGYDSLDKANRILEDYYAIEKKVNDYRGRMLKYGTPDQKKWVNDNSDTRVEIYYNVDGKVKDDKEYMKTFSEKYSADKDTTADRMRVENERTEARFNFYRSAQSLRLNQRDLINASIADENKKIKEHNAEEKKKKAEFDKWSSQKQCDTQFLKSVDTKAGNAASTRRKMMVGSALTGFAGKIVSSIGDKINQAGMIAAGGIIKGERVQVENELKALQEKQQTYRDVIISSVNNANRSYQEGLDAHEKRDLNKAQQAVQNSGDQSLKSTQAAEKYNELKEDILKKQEELEKAKKKEAIEMDKLTEKITGKNDENQKKLVQNQLDKEENAMTELGTQLVDARNQLNVVSRDSKGDVNISDDVIRDLMNAKTDYRREELLKEESEVLKKDKELQKQLNTMQEYSDKLSSLFTPDNLGTVDTIVGIVETLYKTYSTVSGFIGSDEEEKKDEKKDEDNKEKKEEDKKEDDKKEDEKKNDEKEDAKEDDENFELNIKGSINDLKEKAESISKAMRGEGNAEDQGTIIGNITELTMEAGMIANIVTKKIQDITDRMQVSLEEAQAREEVEKGFLAEAGLKTGKSPVASAREELTQQKALHEKIIENDLAANEEAIRQQEEKVKGTKEARDQLLKEMNLLEQREKEEQERKQREEEEARKKAQEEQAEKERAERAKDTPAIKEARQKLEQALKNSQDAKAEKENAETELEKQKRVKDTLDKELRAHETKLEGYANFYDEKIKEANALEESLLPQKEKQEQYISRREKVSSEAGSKIRKTAVKNFFVGMANTTADYTRSFMDQLSIGFAEAVVKGKVKQMEDELAEKENQFRLKGETALAKDRTKLIHVKKAQEISRAENPKLLQNMITDSTIVNNNLETLETMIREPKKDKNKQAYQNELKGAAAAEKDAQKLHKERREISKEIKKMGEDLAKAKVEEEKQLENLHEELKKSYKIDPEAAMKIDVKTEANLQKVKAAQNKMNDPLKELDPVAYIMSTQFSEINANQRQVIKEQLEDLTKDKEMQAKAEQLNKISEKLKGLCTPKNMGRVDTVISVAEGLFSLYGTVKGIVAGGGGGEKEEDEEEKNIAGKIKDIKDKTSDIRKGMMGEGEEKEEEPKVIENVLSITQSMREIMDVVSTKINTIAMNYQNDLDAQRAIKANADKDVNELKEMFKRNADTKIPDAFHGLSTNPQQIVVQLGKTIEISKEALENTSKNVENAKKAYDQINEKFLNAEKDVDKAKKDLEDTIKSEEQRLKDEEAKRQRDLEEAKKREQEEQKRQQEERERQAREAERAERERREQEQAERDRNDKRMKSLNDIMENLKDTGNAYAGHKNTNEFNAVVSQLQSFIDKKDENITFTKKQTENLEKALTDYLDHTGMKVAWHKDGNVRKENVLAALNLINPDKAKEYNAKADKVRSESKRINLDQLMEKEGVKRSADRKRKATAPVEEKNLTTTHTKQK